MSVSIRVVWLLVIVLVTPVVATAQTPLTGDWELSRVNSNSRYSGDYAPFGPAPNITQTEDAVVVWTKFGEVLTYVISPPGDETPRPMFHKGRAYTYVAHFRLSLSGFATLVIEETMVPRPGDAPKVEPTRTVVTSGGNGELSVMMSGPTIEYPDRSTTLSSAFYRRK